MKYEIKNFENKDGKKMVGFWVVDGDSRLAIDKYIPLTEGKTNEEYVQEALELCQTEIAEWQESFAVIGKTWNPETNAFE